MPETPGERRVCAGRDRTTNDKKSETRVRPRRMSGEQDTPAPPRPRSGLSGSKPPVPMPPRLVLYRYCFPRDAASSPWGGHHAAPLARAALWRAPSPPGGGLREILVHPPVVLVALQKLTLDERLDPLLDHVRVGHEAGGQLRSHVGDESVVLHLLARLHDADDRSLDLRLSVLVHLLARLVLLRLRLALRRDRADLEAQLLGGEGGVEGEGVRLVNLAPLRLLEQELELAAREGLQRPLQLGRGDGRVARDVGVAQPVVVVEEQQHAHHVRRHVDLVPRGAELRLEVRVAHRGLPLQSPAGVLLQVVLAEHLAAARHRRGQVAAAGDLGRPEARREHLHRQVDRLDLARAVGGAELVLRVGRHLHVHEHALELGGEGGAALRLELGDHRLLRVDRGRLVEEQPLGEVLLVEGLEQVLAVDVAEEGHRLVQHFLELALAAPLVARAQLRVEKPRHQLRGPVLADVDELLERLLERVAKLLVACEGLREDRVELLLERDELLHEPSLTLLVAHHRTAHALDVRRKGLPQLGQRVHLRKQRVHAPEVVEARVLDEVGEAALEERPHVHREQRLPHRRHQRLARRAVQVVGDASLLSREARGDVLEVRGDVARIHLCSALCEVVCGRGGEELLFEVALVEPEVVEHAQQLRQQRPLHLVAPPLPLDAREHAIAQLGEQLGPRAQLRAEAVQPHLPE
mmetsp:Transcript_20191/g.66839  ORF Transcript_20191/g.66839 Transcript_20191/m.66839 type:complete len:693 (+) Transcript_20191:87-2165(+)